MLFHPSSLAQTPGPEPRDALPAPSDSLHPESPLPIAGQLMFDKVQPSNEQPGRPWDPVEIPIQFIKSKIQPGGNWLGWSSDEGKRLRRSRLQKSQLWRRGEGAKRSFSRAGHRDKNLLLVNKNAGESHVWSVSAPIRLAEAGSVISRLFTENTKGHLERREQSYNFIWEQNKSKQMHTQKTEPWKERDRLLSHQLKRVSDSLWLLKSFPKEQNAFLGCLFVCLQGENKTRRLLTPWVANEDKYLPAAKIARVGKRKQHCLSDAFGVLGLIFQRWALSPQIPRGPYTNWSSQHGMLGAQVLLWGCQEPQIPHGFTPSIFWRKTPCSFSLNFALSPPSIYLFPSCFTLRV